MKPAAAGSRAGGPSVVRGTAINLATKLVAMALVLGITAFTARLGTATQGAFALFTSIEGALLALLSGFGVLLARRVSHHGERPRALLTATVLCCVGVGLGAGLLLLLVAAFGPPAYSMLWLLALAAPVLLLAPNLAGVWLGEGRMAPLAAVSLAPPALTLAGLLALRGLQAVALQQVLAAWVVAKVVVGAALLALLWRRGRFGEPGFAALRAEASFIATIAMSNLLALANYRVGLFVVERRLGLSETGVYSIAVVVAEMLWLVSGSMTQAVYARIGTPDRARAAATTLATVRIGLTTLLAAAPLAWLGAWWLLPRALGPAYAASLLPLALLLPGVLLFGGASALSAYFTNHAGRPQLPARIAALSLAINATLALLLVPRMGSAGAALAATLAYSLSVALLGWLFALHAGLPLSAMLPLRSPRGGG